MQTIQYSDIITQFHDALAELDARFQDGTIAPEVEVEQLREIAKQINGYASDMEFDNKINMRVQNNSVNRLRKEA